MAASHLQSLTLVLVGFGCVNDDALRAAGLALPAGSDFRVEENVASAYAPTRTIRARQDDRVLRVMTVDGIVPGAAERFFGEQRALLTSMYEQRLPPYPEFLTRETGCPARFVPRPEKTAAGRYYQLLYATERLGYGVCNDGAAHFRAVRLELYCPAKERAMFVNLFAPPTTDDEELRRFAAEVKCAD